MKKDIRKAYKLYEDFREATPKRARAIEFALPKAVMVMGPVHTISYDTTHGRKTVLYKHSFHAGSKPLLCADGKGRLFLIEGRYRVTENGIVDLDARGNELDD